MKAYFSTCILVLVSTALHAQTTAFTYQGRLDHGGNPANGNYDFRFTVWNAESGGSLVSGTVGTNALTISNGLFTATLDFGTGIFNGADRWLEINVRTNGGGPFDTLSPRQRLTSAPYAIMAGNVGAGGLAGTYGNAVTFSNSANTFTGTFGGTGAGLSNVNALTLGGVGANGFWRTAGNAGTTPGPNFLGTTDNQPVEIRVNNTRALRIEPSTAPSLIGGFLQNNANGFAPVVIAGGGTSGSPNETFGSYAFVGAGHGGKAGPYSAVVGGAYNSSLSQFSFIGSGERNTNEADYSFVGGGTNNLIQEASRASIIAGGQNNIIHRNSIDATISGGERNTIGTNAGAATIGGGIINSIEASAGSSTIAGGNLNRVRAGATYSAIGGGFLNNIGTNANRATIAGGAGNQVDTGSENSTVSGGINNWVQAGSSSTVISGGANNFIQTNVYSATLAGGLLNTIQTASRFATIGGGSYNVIQTNSAGATIDGGQENVIQSFSFFATVGGGNRNLIGTNAPNSTIAGGAENGIGNDSFHSTLSGGFMNVIQSNASSSVMGGGVQNQIQPGARSSVIAGGGQNSVEANALLSTISGGNRNTIQAGAVQSTIGGGVFNIIQANADSATIPGGLGNSAASFAFAAGQGARANHRGSFVWADSSGGSFSSTANNQFNIRASGGVRIETSGAGLTLDGSVRGSSTDGNGIQGISSSVGGAGVYGENLSGGIGVIGRSSASGIAIYGDNPGGVAGAFTGNLNVTNAAYGGGITLSAGGQPAAYYLSDAGTERAALAYANGPGAYSGDAATGDIVLRSLNSKLLLQSGSGSAALTVATDNRVGIGTGNPQQLLQIGDVNKLGSQGMIRLASRAGVGEGSRHWDIGVPQDNFAINGKFFSFVIDDTLAGTEPEVVVKYGSGNVGIGTTEPVRKLDVRDGPAAQSGSIHVGGTGANPDPKLIYFGDGSFVKIGEEGADDRMQLTANSFVFSASTGSGRVGIGRIAAANRLEVEGEASKTIAGDWLANSDRRIKTDVETITNALQKLEQVRLTSFRYTDDYRGEHPSIEDRKYVNVIAQEFQKVFPESVKSSGDKLPDGDEILQVDTYPLTIYSAAAIQELNRKVAQTEAMLRKQLERRDAENAELKQRLAALERLVAGLTATR